MEQAERLTRLRVLYRPMSFVAALSGASRASLLRRTLVMTDAAPSITDRITTIIVTELGVERSAVVPAARFVEELGADSLDLVELVMEIEQEFEIDVPDDEAATLQTVQQLIAYVAEALG